MMHDLTTVAKNNLLDEDSFVDFARRSNYLSDVDMVSSWNVNCLVEDFKKFRGQQQVDLDRKAAWDKILLTRNKD